MLSQQRIEVFWARVTKTNYCWVWDRAPENRYGRFQVDGKVRGAHVISWEMHHGREVKPGYRVDHKCHNKRCVRPSHLRELTHAQNLQYASGPSKNNTSGVLGVSWNTLRGKWLAQFTKNGQRIHVGYFIDLEEAEAKITEAKEIAFGFPGVEKQRQLLEVSSQH